MTTFALQNPCYELDPASTISPFRPPTMPPASVDTDLRQSRMSFSASRQRHFHAQNILLSLQTRTFPRPKCCSQTCEHDIWRPPSPFFGTRQDHFRTENNLLRSESRLGRARRSSTQGPDKDISGVRKTFSEPGQQHFRRTTVLGFRPSGSSSAWKTRGGTRYVPFGHKDGDPDALESLLPRGRTRFWSLKVLLPGGRTESPLLSRVVLGSQVGQQPPGHFVDVVHFRLPLPIDRGRPVVDVIGP